MVIDKGVGKRYTETEAREVTPNRNPERNQVTYTTFTGTRSRLGLGVFLTSGTSERERERGWETRGGRGWGDLDWVGAVGGGGTLFGSDRVTSYPG